MSDEAFFDAAAQPSYPNWSESRKLGIAFFCGEISEEFFSENPDEQELDTMFRTLYDLINVY